MSDGDDIACIEFYEVDASRWSDFERLFENRGGPKYCWCMAWRANRDEARRTDGPSRKAAMAQRVASGVPVGLLGYLDGVPVAWYSVAPRTTFRWLVGDSALDEAYGPSPASSPSGDCAAEASRTG
nr:hypothetical protein [Thermobaculum terrenum]